MYKRRYGNKYNNRKVVVDGYEFDSQKEAAYYEELKLRKRAGDIIDFELQPKIVLQEGFTYDGKKIREIAYKPDFIVYHDGLTEIVDVKGFPTPEFKIKWKILQYKYQNTKEYKLTII